MENALVKQENQPIEVRKDENKKILFTLDLNKEENIDKLLASQDKDNVKYVKDNVGKVIDCIGVYVTQRTFEDVNQDGEVVNRKKHATLLFDKDGDIKRYREFKDDHTRKFDIDYQREPSINKTGKSYHIHYYGPQYKNEKSGPIPLSKQELSQYIKFFDKKSFKESKK